MFKKLILVGFIFLFSSNLARAEVRINEIMYDLEGSDAGGEWVEIYNDSNTTVDLSTFKFFEAETNHGLVVFQGDANIGAYNYAVIVSDNIKFKTIWPDFSGTIFISNFSLHNDGEALAIKDESLNIVDTVTYNSSQGANGNGNSLSKINNVWVGVTPTPGLINKTANTINEASSGSSSGSSISSTNITETKTKIVEEVKIKTQITSNTFGFVGIPLSLQATTYGHQGEKLYYGKYFWNFGDGDSKEVKLTESQPFSHTYFYPGEYVIMLDYYQNYYSNIPDAFSQIVVKIIGADISISGVGDEKDFFIELSNNTDFNADISNWILVSNEKKFTIPRNTILASKKKMIISPKITNFSFKDKDTLKLMTPQQEVAFVYQASPSTVVLRQDLGARTVRVETPISQNEEESLNLAQEETGILQNNLVASASSPDIVKNINTNNLSTKIIFIISFIFIGIGAYVVYFIRQKRIVSTNGNDFEILDE